MTLKPKEREETRRGIIERWPSHLERHYRACKRIEQALRQLDELNRVWVEAGLGEMPHPGKIPIARPGLLTPQFPTIGNYAQVREGVRILKRMRDHRNRPEDKP